MSALIFGVGVGLFIIIVLWAAALLLCLVSLRAQRNIGTIGIVAASLITAFLLLVPHDSYSEPAEISLTKIYDRVFVWRILLTVLLSLSAVAGSVVFVYTHLMEPRYARPIKHFKVE